MANETPKSAAPAAPLPSGVLLDASSAGRPMLRLEPAEYGRDWRTGDALTPYGIVSIYTQGRGGEHSPHTRLDFIWAGRFCSACWQRTFQDRFLITMAVRFAALCALGNASASEIAKRPLPGTNDVGDVRPS